MKPMPVMAVRDYSAIRDLLEPGMVVFFSKDTDGLKKLTPIGYASWRIKHLQLPPCECTHVGIIDVVRDRRLLIEATAPKVQVGPLSACVGRTAKPDGKYVDAYDGKVYVGMFMGCDGELAADDVWNNLLLPYDYLDVVALRLGKKRSDTSRYICSELVAEALGVGGAKLDNPANGWAYTPADLMLSSACRMLWRLR